MDLPISCQDIHYIYKHPLSILIHQKFQDKDGCSRNGSKELLDKINEIIGDNKGYFPHKSYKRIDHRGVCTAFYIHMDGMNELGEVIRQKMLNWKCCQFSFRSTPSIPIVQQDAEILRLASDHIKLYNSDIDEFIYNPASVSLIGVVPIFGRVSFIQLNKLDDGRIIDQIASLPYLTGLSYYSPLSSEQCSYIPDQIGKFSFLYRLYLVIGSDFISSCQFFSLFSNLRILEFGIKFSYPNYLANKQRFEMLSLLIMKIGL